VREPDGKPDVVLLASGSEFGLARDAADELELAGVKVRVVSIPCLELFLGEPEEYQQRLVPDDGTLVVAVEAGVGESYRRLVGRRGLVYGIDRFGASAPAADLAGLLDLTPNALAKKVLANLR
jgi:transketolase